MCKIGHEDALHVVLLRHFMAIFVFPYNELEPPEPVSRQTESTAYCWPFWIAEKSKALREEGIIYVQRSVAPSPEWKIGMALWGRKA